MRFTQPPPHAENWGWPERSVDVSHGSVGAPPNQKIPDESIKLSAAGRRFRDPSPDETDITLTAALHSGRVEVAVVDEGIGVSPHNLDNVFTPFFRAENIETQRETGTGLGLTVVKALVELHGGQVEIESEPGRGTSVNFWIPGVTEQPAS